MTKPSPFKQDHPQGCREWPGGKNRGYGVMGWKPKDGSGLKSVAYYAHRIAWEMANGPIPEGLFVCHKCDNPSCVRVDHLFLGTAADNSEDAIRKGRIKRGPPRPLPLTPRLRYGPNCQEPGCDRLRKRGEAWCRRHGRQRYRARRRHRLQQQQSAASNPVGSKPDP